MSSNWMLTIPRHKDRESIELVKLLQWMIDHDVHKWIIASETGTGGYEHWQVRMRNNLSFAEMKEKFTTAHIEEASDNYEYERKEGSYYTSEDNVSILRARFGEPRKNQRRILDNIRNQNDREIDVIVDTRGNTGKSWLCRHLFERGIGYYVPPTMSSVQSIIQYVANGYRGEEVVIVDIPRSTRWTNQLYVCIETVKDGLVYDARYHTQIRNISGAKVLVMCNEKPKLDKLSKDRWRLYNANGEPLTAELSDPIS